MKQIYTFDAIVVSGSLPLPRASAIDNIPGQIYSIRVFNDFEDIPMDRLGVQTFPPLPLGQFNATPCELIGALTTKGVCVTLKESDQIVGTGTVQLGPSILRQLADSKFEVTQNVMVELMSGNTSVGKLELLIKLASSDPGVNHTLTDFGCYDVCRPAASAISKKDIIFTLGRSGKCATSTCITDERLMSHAGAPFQCPHAEASKKADGASTATRGCGCFVGGMTVKKDEAVEKKREKAALNKLIDELGLDKVKPPKPPKSHELSRKWHCKCGQQMDTTSTDPSTLDSSESLRKSRRKSLSLTASRERRARKKLLGLCPAKVPDLTAQPYKPPTLCHLCQSDISWLPKVAACPYCGYKTYEDIPPSEQEYDITATAQQLLTDSLRKETCEVDTGAGDGIQLDSVRQLVNQEDPNLPKPCGCIAGKPCTRCRIRKLCENFFKETESKQATLNQAVGCLSRDPEKELKQTGSATSHRRKQLINIFTEMRNIYGKKPGASEEEAKAEQQRKECEAFCKKSKSAKARRRARMALQKALQEIDQAYPKPPKIRKRKRRHRPSKYYTFLKPQVRAPRISHVNCITDSDYTGYCKVPCYMGWMWTKSEMARYKSWRPGAISKPTRKLMAYFLKDFPTDSICLSRYHYRNRKSPDVDDPEEQLVQHPTLHICRKGDEYTITLRPLKDPKSLAVCANPYADMKPLVFRITKDPTAVALREMKVALQEKGFAPCTCGRPVSSCFCRSHVDKKRIQYEVEMQCRQRGLQNNIDTFVYSTNSDDECDSDNEYEFGVTPPAGVIKPERTRKPDRACAETQYAEMDWVVPSLYPHPANMYVQYGSCPMGERKKFFQWTYGKGNIHAEPKKPKMRNYPKKKKRPRAKGGFVDPRYFDNSTPLNRPWHKSS
ncbi:hypothetical protein KR018_009748, partial [Drosophila ironensis]